MLKAQGLMPKLLKDATNPHLKNRYASMTSVLETVRKPLTEAGLVLYQSASAITDESGKLTVVVRSMLIHGDTGESVEEQIAMPVAQNTPQAIGSAITYGRRYLAVLQCGLAPDDDDDDDGNASSAQTTQRNGKVNTTAKVEPKAEMTKTVAAPEKERKAFHGAGVDLFADEWDQVRPLVVERYTGKQTPDNKRTSSNDLTAAELAEITKTFKASAPGWRNWWTETKPKADPVAA